MNLGSDIMRTPRLYLETTIFNYNFVDDAPDKKIENLKLFQDIRNGLFEPYTTIVVDELLQASEPKKKMMLGLITQYNISVLPVTAEINDLANVYVKNGIIPQKYTDDARHIACATIYDMDIIVSWNFKHIVKRKTIIMTEQVNLIQGYKRVEIYSPAEVTSNEDI